MIDQHKSLKCAVYTRKSSEEGLEQSFNSLDAQREAAQAYIQSQKEEGWRLLPARYDDGGYSGGNLNRPALQRLLADVEAKKVDIIVVYKVDRLTRSLADFAKIVEALDARGVSFVSVTQQFNTTSSMGRLTLNVLLSFAQFEREVTGERIRDKIAASKKRGMWMGGHVPIGYTLDGRNLIPSEPEAEVVNEIFRRYLKLGYVSKLKMQLHEAGIRSNIWTTRSGRQMGGVSFGRGALYHLLRNRIYLGEIVHHEVAYPGQHEPIIARQLWEQVQAKLSDHNQGRKNGLAAKSTSLLTGLIRDEDGNAFTPSHTSKAGRRYRYYVSNPDKRQSRSSHHQSIRLPGHEIENAVVQKLAAYLRCERDVLDELHESDDHPEVVKRLLAAANRLSKTLLAPPSSSGCDSIDINRLLHRVVYRIRIRDSAVELLLSKNSLRSQLLDLPHEEKKSLTGEPENLLSLKIQGNFKRCGSEMRLVLSPDSGVIQINRKVPSLLKAVARGYEWRELLLTGGESGTAAIARRVHVNVRYIRKVLQCGFLAPDIVESILRGQQPPDLTFQKATVKLPMSWEEQRRTLGFLRGESSKCP